MSSPEMPEPQTPGPLETNDGPRCPNCEASIRAGITLCPNCGYAMPPLPTLAGTPEADERYLTGSRAGDTLCGILTAILLPVLLFGPGFVASQGGVSQAVGSLLTLLAMFGPILVIVGPIAVQLGTRKRFPAFARAHGKTWKIMGILFVLLFLGLLALCVYSLSGPH